MSKQTPEDNQDLAQVLSRIDALMKHGDAPAVVLDDAIPLLTEVYEGEPLTFTSHTPKKAVAQPLRDSTDVGSRLMAAGLTEELLDEILPLIQAAVRKAVQQELANAEQTLTGKIEADLVESLRQRLKS